MLVTLIIYFRILGLKIHPFNLTLMIFIVTFRSKHIVSKKIITEYLYMQPAFEILSMIAKDINI